MYCYRREQSYLAGLSATERARERELLLSWEALWLRHHRAWMRVRMWERNGR